MKTFPSLNESTGHVFAFEIERIYLCNSTIGRILSEIPGVSDIKVRRLFSEWREIHVWFKYGLIDFVVWEPYGDNSRLWIGPEDGVDDRVDIERVRIAFEKYQPPMFVGIVGDILSLRIPSPVMRVLKRIFLD